MSGKSMVVLLASALVLLGGAALLAASGQEVSKGNGLYRVYCSSCHGATGKGDGKLANLLTVKPSDLTTIAKRSGGKFDGDKVQSYVDGREEVRAHGDADMPVWGLSFQDPNRAEPQESEVKVRLRALVAYLETIQVR